MASINISLVARAVRKSCSPFETTLNYAVPVFLSLALTANLAGAADADAWFTLMGDPTDGTVDTVQLNIANVEARGEIHEMPLRVNLARQRTMPNGEQYSSYTSQIAVECKSGSVFHLEQTRYVDRNWNGTPTREVFTNTKPMAFGGLVPNPKPGVLRAACAASDKR